MLRPWRLISLLGLSLLFGCDNHRYQSSIRTYENGAARFPPEGTTPLSEPTPRPKVTRELLREGQALYNIHCVVCHSYTGDGQGILTFKGYHPLPALEEKGAEFTHKVLTQGHEKMPRYNRRLLENEKWAVASYVEALVLSRKFPINELDDVDREKIP